MSSGSGESARGAVAPAPAGRVHSRHERWNLQTAAGDDLFGSTHSAGERMQPAMRATLRRGMQGPPTRPRGSTSPRAGEPPWRRARCGAAARRTTEQRAGRVGHSGRRARRGRARVGEVGAACRRDESCHRRLPEGLVEVPDLLGGSGGSLQPRRAPGRRDSSTHLDYHHTPS